jgi:phosphatidylinositol-3-phosphatase
MGVGILNFMKNKLLKLSLLVGAFAILIVAFVIFSHRKSNPPTEPPVATETPQPMAQPPSVQRQIVKHVLIVVEENTSYEDIIGNEKDMPYLNQLAKGYSYAANYFGNTHPSMGNYFMLTAGDIISNNDNYSKTVTEDNVVRKLIAAGKTWKEYSEGLPTVGYTGSDKGDYTEHHNPLSYFSDVRENPEQEKNLVPFSQFSADLKNNGLPNYSFIVPNQSHDAHSCPSGVNCLAAADGWLKDNIGPLLESPDFNSPGGGLLIILFDEGKKSDHTNGGAHTAWVAVGPDLKKGYISNTFYQHENTLRFTLELLGINDFPGKAKDAASMTEFLEER